MPEIYVTLEEASQYEGIKYKTLVQRISRDPKAYNTILQPREKGGKDQVMVAISSLSAKARKAYRVGQKVSGTEVIIEKRTHDPPWYVSADLNWYIENHKKAYYEAVETARKVEDFIAYSDGEKTLYADRFALQLGISQRTLYRYAESVLEASAWSLKFEQEDGYSRDHYKAMSLCRKPKERGTFPSLGGEQRAIVENIWFDQGFSANRGTVEMLYERFEIEAERRGWDGYPSIKTVHRYIKSVMARRGAESAKFLAGNGTREWRNKQMIKAKRDHTTLDVMELVVGDEHTFDCWVQYTAPNGKVKAVRPKLVAWMDMRTRCIMGDVICIEANSQILKESVVKMTYDEVGGIPKVILIDNGKDYTAETMTGQSRKNRQIEFDFDSETWGFYQSIGIQRCTRAKPYQPWVKDIERVFGTVCTKFVRWFDSYTGTLTGSKTDGKVKKDIQKMLERGELLTMEEFYEAWTKWKNEKYHTRVHRSLKADGERWHTPIELYQNATRYVKAVPPRDQAAMLLMKAAQARVTAQGINKFGTLYTHYELGFYKDKTVGIKWDLDDVTRLYVFDREGRKICEAESAELLQFGERCSQASLKKHLKAQRKQEREVKELLSAVTQPYEARLSESSENPVIGRLDLMVKASPEQKVIALPKDKEYRAEVKSRQAKRKSTQESDRFFAKKAEDVLAQLRAMNE